MGCDIHMRAEQRNDDGDWEFVSDFAFTDTRGVVFIDRTYPLDTLTDGQLLDVVLHIQPQPEGWLDTLSEQAREVVKGAAATRPMLLGQQWNQDVIGAVGTWRGVQVLHPAVRGELQRAIEALPALGEEDGDKWPWAMLTRASSEQPWKSRQPYQGRNYELFARLADVRNYDGTDPLFEGRGIPSDASDEGAKWMESWGQDGHSHTHFTLAELLAEDWSKRPDDDWDTYAFWREAMDGMKAVAPDNDPRRLRVLAFFDN